MRLEKLLSELEKDKLSFVANDKVMLGAIKKVVLSAVYFDGTLQKDSEPEAQKNFALALAAKPNISNEALGAELKASLAGVQLLETGFRELEKYAVEKVTLKEAVNQAR